MVEVAYTPGVSSSSLKESIRSIGTTPDLRLKRLRRLLAAKPIVRVLEVHNGLSGLIVEKTDKRVTIQTVNERILMSIDDIQELTAEQISMMDRIGKKSR